MRSYPAKTFPALFVLLLAASVFAPLSSIRSAAKTIECTVILDQQTGAAIVRSGTCDERFTPSSANPIPFTAPATAASQRRGHHLVVHADVDLQGAACLDGLRCWRAQGCAYAAMGL